MFPFDLPENIRKPLIPQKTSENLWFSDIFRGIKRENWGKERSILEANFGEDHYEHPE